VSCGVDSSDHPRPRPAPDAAARGSAHLVSGDDRFKRFIEHLPAGVVIHRQDGTVVDANAAAANMLGMTMEVLCGSSAHDDSWRFLRNDGSVMPREEFPAVRSLQLRADLNGLVVGVERPDTHTTSWLLCNTLLIHEDVTNAPWVVVSFNDCTELKTVQNSLRLSEERLRLILLGTNDAPWDWDLQSDALYYSGRWWAMIGRSPDELPSDPELWSRLLHPEDVLPVQRVLKRALSSETTYEVEFRLQHKDGHYVPVLSRGFVLRDENGQAIRLSGTNTDLSERKKAEHSIHQLAYFDQLTGLPNRRYLLEHAHHALSRAARTGQIGALLFLDLDNFKDLNDTQGHDIGDLMLRQFAERLRQVLRDADHLARLGGDEFVVVVEDLGTARGGAAAEVEAVANKLLAASVRKFFLPGMDYTITPSIGITMFDRDSDTVESLLKQADLAMYGAKAAGRGLVRFFDPKMQSAVDERSALEIGLRNAIAGNQFVLYCQPQFGESGLVGGEMLLRWQHPEKGLIGPGAFIELAEASGLILPIGSWVLREACRTIAAWRDDPVLGGLRFSINVSAQQLHNRDFVEQTLSAINAEQIDPSRICLELTESLLADDVADATEKMTALRSHGIHFSIDDFGTGYSSLSYLQRFPLYALKIDQSFVQDEKATAIVEVIISLGKKLGLKVVAEGVETSAQFAALKEKGCKLFQGYYFGRPMPLSQFSERYRGQGLPPQS
jgi:diguanylate cyclase (GGDEF)-like protein/PAS domain S-box-containing protein